jgi:L-alanine-DL-glutamate epimerase-like enolase superfamily enzyme
MVRKHLGDDMVIYADANSSYEVTRQGGRFRAVDGRLAVPTTPGFGITFDPDYLSGLEVVRV